jgi:hypothetical protein
MAASLAALSLGLFQQPMIGVACHGANVTTCGRIGIAVWLNRPAKSVDAELAGTHLRLHAGGFGGSGPTYSEGYVHIAARSLRLPKHWYGTKPVRLLTLRLTIRYPRRIASGALRLRLRPGWG